MGMITIGTADIKSRLSEFISRVCYSRERIIIARRGKPVAALVGINDLRRLEILERDASQKKGETAHPIMRAFGGWADRTDTDDLVAAIYADREAAAGREVDL